MTTRPTLSSYPEDAELWKWTKDVEGFVEDLIGSNNLPSAPAEVKVVSQQNSVKVTFRAVNEVGVTEYNVYRGTDKNFAGGNSELIATVTQAIDPSGTDIVYTDVEAVEKSYYFVSAVKGLRRPRLEGPVAGFGSATTGHAIGEDLTGGGTISGFTGIPGSILFVNEDSLIDQDNENFFYSQTLRAMVVGTAGLMWGSQLSPDVVLTRDSEDTLALKRLTNNQTFRIYETSSAATPAITQNLLLADGDDIDRQVYTTASIAPLANRLVICMVMAADQGFNDVIHVDSVTGAGMTWVEMVDLNFDTIASERRCLAIYRALDPSPAGGALTITLDKVGTAARWIIVEFGNIDTSGTNGSGAIVQNATNRADAGLSITATLASFASSSNATIGCFGSGSVNTTLTEGSGFAKIGEVDLGSIKAMMTFRNDNDTTVDMSQAVDGDMAVVAFEIRSVGQNERFIELIGLGSSGEAEVMSVTGAGITDRDLVVGTRGSSSLRFYVNDIEAARFGPSGGAAINFLHSQNFTSDGSGTASALHRLSGTLNGAVGDTGSLFAMDIDPFRIETQTATESIANVASLNIEEPKIVENLTGDITVASTVRIGGSPDEALTNWALNVVSGDTNLGGALDVYGFFTVFNNATRQAQTQIRMVQATAFISTGSSVTLFSLIPAGSFVIGITTRVLSVVTGPAGYDVGDGTDVDRWGNSISVALDTTSDIADFTSGALILYPAANDVIITSDGVDFTGGVIRATVHYMTLVAPIS